MVTSKGDRLAFSEWYMCEISLALGFVLTIDGFVRIPSRLTSLSISGAFWGIGFRLLVELDIVDEASESYKFQVASYKLKDKSYKLQDTSY